MAVSDLPYPYNQYKPGGPPILFGQSSGQAGPFKPGQVGYSNASGKSIPVYRQYSTPTGAPPPNLDPNINRNLGGGGVDIGNPNADRERAAASQPSVEDQQRNAYFEYLDKMAGGLGGQQSDLEGQVNNLFGSQSQSINTGLQGSLGQLDLSRQNISSNKATSLRDLDVNMRNQLRAGNIYLGAKGASDSSATNQYALALGKAGSQNRTEVMKQANQLYAQVDQQTSQVKALAQDELQKLETWKNNNLLQISQYIQSLRGNIDQAKANYIQQQLAALDNQVNSYREAVTNWVTTKATSLSQLQQQLQQFGVGPNPTINSGSLAQLSMGGQSNYTPLFGQLRRDETTGLA